MYECLYAHKDGLQTTGRSKNVHMQATHECTVLLCIVLLDDFNEVCTVLTPLLLRTAAL